MAFRDLLPDIDFRKLDTLGYDAVVKNGVCHIYLNGNNSPLVSSSDKGFIFNYICSLLAASPSHSMC